jgi:hypothetical protein
MNTLNIFVVGFLLSTVSLPAGAGCVSTIPANTPSSRFVDNSDGTATDMKTGLMWMRCALGQTWTGATCTGTVSKYVWSDALAQAQAATFASHSDWRVPNVKELLSIVERSCAPAINSEIFPATSTWSYWTSSPNVSGNATDAYLVGFGQGGNLVDHKTSVDTNFQYPVRLVRNAR